MILNTLRAQFAFSVFLFLFAVSFAFSQTVNISGIVNSYAPVTLISSCSIDVSDASAFSAGNRVMIIQMKGALVDTSNTVNFGDILNLNNCGNYEFAHVSAVSGNTVFLNAPLQRSYDISGSVQLIKVPQYTNAVITSPLTCPNWNDITGGVIVIECSGTLTFNDSIDAKGKGFALGNVSPTGYSCPGSFDYFYPASSYFGGEKGKGISVLSFAKRNGMGKLGNGGGGGNNVNAGGGGGGNFGGGGNGGYSWEGCPIMDIGGRGGQGLTYSNTLKKVFLGGGGGGGQQNNLQATPGTNGGGIVIIRAAGINGNGNTINAGTFDVLTGGCDGTGGGGGGGSVLLDVNTISGILNVNAKGGDGAFPTCYLQGASGGGGGGVVWSKTPLPVNVSFNVSKGVRGIHGNGSQDGQPGDTLSGLTIIGTPFTYVPLPITSSPDDSICLGFAAALNVAPNGTGYTYSWNPAAGLNNASVFNPAASPAVTTVYHVILTDPNGCVSSDSVIVTLKPKPVAAFSCAAVCSGTVSQFNDNSTTSPGTISTRNWNFGDASPLNTAPSPAYTYAGGGTYNASLIVTNNFGCADTITKPVQVHYVPTTGFTHNDVCIRDTMHFINTSSISPPASISGFLWIFGDGGASSTLQNPVHYYSSSNTYNVTLVANTADGCSGVVNISVKVFDAPVSAFARNNACLLDSVFFTNNSLNPSMGSIAGWSWNFGDASPLETSVLNPVHKYAAPGNYQVSLITHSTNLGCADTASSSVTIFPLPVSDFNFANVCLHQSVSFNDSSRVASGLVLGRVWNFGDSTPADTVTNPPHIYSSPGTYSVSLIVTTDMGCKDTVIKNTQVHPLPDIHFSYSNVCDGGYMHFHNSTVIASPDNIQSWIWNFGSGSSGVNSVDDSALYAHSGSYNVKLTALSGFGCIDSITKIVTVNPKPYVDFTTADTAGCQPLCAHFQDLSNIASGTNAAWLWNFGDGNTASNSDNLVHCFDINSSDILKSFNIKLTVTSDSGCVASNAKNNYITVYPLPQASFSVDPASALISNPVINFTKLPKGADFWNWNFGDHDTSSFYNQVSHTYADTGSFLITVIVSTHHGCRDSASRIITIEPEFFFYIPSSFSPNDDRINDTFSGQGIFVSEYNMMIFDRWGNLIFFTDDLLDGWDGRANHGSEIAAADVYIYVINLTDTKKQKHSYKGIVTLLK